jgi:hypothetical protein
MADLMCVMCGERESQDDSEYCKWCKIDKDALETEDSGHEAAIQEARMRGEMVGDGYRGDGL